jgi:hypothetical protein
MEKPDDGIDIPENHPSDEVGFTQARDWLGRKKIQDDLAKRDRQADRLQGHLTASLMEKLRACTIDQLREAKKLCDRYITDQRKPPPPQDCGERYTVTVLSSVCVKNKRYQLEFQRSTKAAKKIYANGPYIRGYYRDGKIIRVDRFRSKDKELYKKLPRKVWSAFKERMSDPALESQRQAIIVKLNEAAARDRD